MRFHGIIRLVSRQLCRKFMAFKSFSELQHKPLLVDLTVEEGTRLKVPSLPNLTIDGAGVVAVSI